MDYLLGNTFSDSGRNCMDTDSGLDIAGHILNFGIWIYLLIIAFKINQISFNLVLLPLFGLIGSLIFNIMKLTK